MIAAALLTGLMVQEACSSPVHLMGDAGEGGAGDTVPPGCGDGIRMAGEECDDGNALGGDGCEPDCRFSCHHDTDCQDGLPCTFDICEWGPLVGKICTHRAVSGQCAIDGSCWSAGEPNLERSCEVCAPELDPFAWSPADAGTLCDNGVYCDGPDACDGGGRCTGIGGPPCAVEECATCDEAERRCRTAAAGTACRPSRGPCDPVEACTGSIMACPEDVVVPAGTPCNDGDACSGPDACDGSGACLPGPALIVPGAPASIAPANGRPTGSLFAPTAARTLRPGFAWTWNDDGCGEPSYEIQVDDSCSTPGFRSCEFDSPEAAATGVSGRRWRPTVELPVSRSAPVGRRYYWRARACRGERCSGWSDVRYADVGVADGDVNGDGYSDLAVGAHGQRSASADDGPGAVYVYLGGPDGPDSAPSLRFFRRSDPVIGEFGTAVASGCDLDADGFADLIVGGAMDHADGAVVVFPGGPDGPGYAHGQVVPAPLPGSGGRFGSALDCGGDVNGDGFADVLVGAHSIDDVEIGAGNAYLFLGAATGEPLTRWATFRSPSPAEAGSFGDAVALGELLGDDGFADVLVGAPNDLSAGYRTGRAYVFAGRATGPPAAPVASLVPESITSELFGAAVAAGADVDGDQRGDLAVGAKDAAMMGGSPTYSVSVFGGTFSAPPARLLALTGPGAATRDGSWQSASISNVDLDADTLAEVIHGGSFGESASADREASSVVVYRGAVGGPAATPWVVFSLFGPAEWEHFGADISAVDLDSDGTREVVVGAPEHTAGATQEGGVFIYRLDSSPVDPEPWIVLDNPDNQVRGHFGATLAP